MKKNNPVRLIAFFTLVFSSLLFSCRERPKQENTAQHVLVLPSAPEFSYTGRFDLSNPSQARFAWSGSAIDCIFEGPFCQLLMDNLSQANEADGSPRTNYYRIAIDDMEPFVLQTIPGKTEYLLADSLSDGPHHLSIFKRTEAEVATGVFLGLKLAPGKRLLKPENRPARKIEFIGNSITCGYGNEGDSRDCHFSSATENAWETYSAITARNLNAQYVSVCFSGRGMIQNYNRSQSGTMPELYQTIIPGEDSLKWNFQSWIPDIVVINLGTNDFAHENPNASKFVTTCANFLKTIRGNYPEAAIVCLSGPMMTNDGARKPLGTLQRHIDEAIAILAAGGEKKIYRFDLTSQGPLGYGCDWHPNLAQHQLNAEELTTFLRGLE
ncbi:MAG: SGNH/GDSL hydrolase family protein [Bacteroidia bacterium]